MQITSSRQASVRVAACAAALAGCAQAPLQQPGQTALEAVVPAIASRFSACDLDALMTSYAPGIEFVSPTTPKPVVGLQAVREHLAGACDAGFRPVMTVVDQRVRMLSSQAAVVTGAYTIGRTDRPGEKPWPAFFVVTVQRIDGRWLVNTQATVPTAEP
jgi:uncharacterized protein (TIGR02246 family)